MLVSIQTMKIVGVRKNQLINWLKNAKKMLYIVLFSIIFTINVGIGTYFVFYRYMNRDNKTCAKEQFYFLGIQATIIKRNPTKIINGTSQKNKH